MSALITWISLVLSFLGRPPFRPRARAALRPAIVRSRMRFRSNSASEAHMKDELSCRRAGLNFFGQRFEIDAARPELGCEIYEITETATQSVQSPNDESVTFTQRFQASLKL